MHVCTLNSSVCTYVYRYIYDNICMYVSSYKPIEISCEINNPWSLFIKIEAHIDRCTYIHMYMYTTFSTHIKKYIHM